ncbi:MAG: 2-amino-4-hydroxy-6-hydroxymethyldihydropteridine diphosphokinase [Kiritimatiellaeota bacterium]|nr:2-amino-4-hydroxy-6-hydroxymethyldihydropteridine diphosphokinase [Kiritimatiellota bacterium]
MEVGLSLGSNLGDRLAHLATARRRLMTWPGVRLLAASPVYETEPVGVSPAYWSLVFLNAVLIVDGEQAPADWQCATAQIEMELGRVRTADRCAPRAIDIDILFIGDRCLDDGGLILPHPRWAQRRFVLQPLADVRPDLVLPGAAETVRQILARLPAGEKVVRFSETW